MFRQSKSTTALQHTQDENSKKLINDSGIGKTPLISNNSANASSNKKPTPNYLRPTNTSLSKRATPTIGLQRSGSVRAHKSQGDLRAKSSTPLSRNASAKNASTPLHKREQALNFSGGSAILSPSKQRIPMKDLGGGGAVLKPSLTAGSMGARRNLGDFNGNVVPRGPMKLLPIGQDSESHNSEIELSILRAAYMRSVFLAVGAEQAVKQVEIDGLLQISHLWKCNKQLTERIFEVEQRSAEIKQMLQFVKMVKVYEEFLLEYGNLQTEVSATFDKLSAEVTDRQAHIKLQGLSIEQKDDLKGNVL